MRINDGREFPVATASRLKDGCELKSSLTRPSTACRNGLSAEGWLREHLPLPAHHDRVATASRLKDGCEKMGEKLGRMVYVATASRLKDGCEPPASTQARAFAGRNGLSAEGWLRDHYYGVHRRVDESQRPLG